MKILSQAIKSRLAKNASIFIIQTAWAVIKQNYGHAMHARPNKINLFYHLMQLFLLSITYMFICNHFKLISSSVLKHKTKINFYIIVLIMIFLFDSYTFVLK